LLLQKWRYASFGEKLSQIKQPTLILWGDSIAFWERLMRTSLKMRSHILTDLAENCGHVPHLDSPNDSKAYQEFRDQPNNI
jgi:pimeloyl-ACP methyl ester carboxylesterase